MLDPVGRTPLNPELDNGIGHNIETGERFAPDQGPQRGIWHGLGKESYPLPWVFTQIT